MRISVFGLGYVGCVTAASLAQDGHEVIGVDVDSDKVRMINDAVSPVIEPGLKELLSSTVRSQKLRATVYPHEAVTPSELALICVGTPGMMNGRLDVRAVEHVGRELGQCLKGRSEPFTVVLRSTILPGTTEEVLMPALKEGSGNGMAASFRVAVNPEFMREGSSLKDFRRPPLTLIGCEDEETFTLLEQLYAGVEASCVHTGIRTAEMTKYVANAFHGLKICFANEIADLCSALGADPHEVMRIFTMDRKLNISEAYLRPGFAFGGSCLPKDIRALVYAGRTAEVPLPLLTSILPSNESQIRRAVELTLMTRRRRVGVIGLSFKPGSDDLRESPMVALTEQLIGKGCDVRILDRDVSIAKLIGANRRYIQEEIPHLASVLCDSVELFLAHAEVLVVGNAGEEATLALSRANPKHIIVDLTRGTVLRQSGPKAGEPV